MAGDEPLDELKALTERTKASGEALARNGCCTIVSQTLSPTYGSYARAIVKNRDRLRQRLPAFLVCDPAFDILLELFAAHEDRKNLSVTSVCMAAGCPPTTALRWIKVLETENLIERHSDPDDGRRIFLRIKGNAHDLVHNWLAVVSNLPLR